MDAFEKSGKYRSTHRAVAEVIATLLLVVIAAVGGSVILAFSQEFFSHPQISGTPTIELVKILGYDARDVTNLEAHDGQTMSVVSSDPNTLERMLVKELLSTLRTTVFNRSYSQKLD